MPACSFPFYFCHELGRRLRWARRQNHQMIKAIQDDQEHCHQRRDDHRKDRQHGRDHILGVLTGMFPAPPVVAVTAGRTAAAFTT